MIRPSTSAEQHSTRISKAPESTPSVLQSQGQARSALLKILRDGVGFVGAGVLLTGMLGLSALSAMYGALFNVGPCDHLKD